MSEQIDPSEYEDLPRTEPEWRRHVWARLKRIEVQAEKTNGRLRHHERVFLITLALLAGYLIGQGIHLPIPLVAVP